METLEGGKNLIFTSIGCLVEPANMAKLVIDFDWLTRLIDFILLLFNWEGWGEGQEFKFDQNLDAILTDFN